MVFKLLAVVIILFLVYLVFFKRDREKEIKKMNKKEDKKLEAIMEECPKCKIFVAKDDAIISNGKYYCSKECL
ncbi:MAG: hypothetical protein HRT40_10720 [Campylobacteraceae bacterium]|nr:hypothetical protein [Campylobacteraceae bacterium]